METVTLLHNPKAGGKEHTKEELVGLLESAGYKCHYFNTKKSGWDKIEPDTDFIVIAGGDGTIRKVLIKLAENKTLYPVALIPLGTANNISRTLNITGNPAEIINSWKNAEHINFNVCQVTGLEKGGLFLEGLGIGAFPELMQVMTKVEKVTSLLPEKEIETALKTFTEIIKSMPAVACKLEINGQDYSGNYILAEIMNTRSIGPNLDLNPTANPGDGVMEVILVDTSQRDELVAYVEGKPDYANSAACLKTIKGRTVKISWENAAAHIDDELVEPEGQVKTEVAVNKQILQFIVPVKSSND